MLKKNNPHSQPGFILTGAVRHLATISAFKRISYLKEASPGQTSPVLWYVHCSGKDYTIPGCTGEVRRGKTVIMCLRRRIQEPVRRNGSFLCVCPAGQYVFSLHEKKSAIVIEKTRVAAFSAQPKGMAAPGGGAAIKDFERFQFERNSDIIAPLEGPVL